MRKDVKIGGVVGVAVVIVAGTYYLTGNDTQKETRRLAAEGSDAQLAAEPLPEMPAKSFRQPSPEPTPAVAARGQRDAVGGAPSGVSVGAPVAPPVGVLPPALDLPETAADALVDAFVPTGSELEAGNAEPPAGGLPMWLTADRPPVDDAVAAAPVGGNAPIARENAEPEGVQDSYTVQRGDSLAILAEVFYGSQLHMPFLLAANPQVSAERPLLVGTVLRIPPLTAEARQAVDAAKAAERAAADATTNGVDTYVVEPGDSFYLIAAERLGSGARWQELFELNKGVVKGDPRKLRPGQVLKLPSTPDTPKKTE